PDMLLLEITESMMFPHPDQTREILEKFSDMRIAIAIDDFGTGYSSLAYLRDFPIDYLKIDRSFVNGVPADTSACTITKTIVAMAKNLGLKVIAEGVETPAQLNFLRASGCDEAQGYYFSKPVPAAAAEALLKAGKVPAAEA
ncbi:MAG TPA: EAL domain-containing protein, partial [Gammaproteobacteria bacterium]|nr:EAL domain-containing protein [Gammaproteobacteria bacterium]